MPSTTRLGGFKILEDMISFTTVISKGVEITPSQLLRAIANKKINLPFLTLFNNTVNWGMNAMVEASDGMIMSFLMEERLGNEVSENTPEVAILSIFPHNKNPEITGLLFTALHDGKIKTCALANSPSAISVVLKKDALSKASNALFQPFSFGAYRTPADWKLAHKGREELHKEVVASFQEQKPKVYGLEYYDDQKLIKIRLNDRELSDFGDIFLGFAKKGMTLTFSSAGSCGADNNLLFFCLTRTEEDKYFKNLLQSVHGIDIYMHHSNVAVFSMNGPHFGDRYGLASELLAGFDKNGIELLGLNCTIASITGIVPASKIEPAIQAIKNKFQVPTILKKC